MTSIVSFTRNNIGPFSNHFRKRKERTWAHRTNVQTLMFIYPLYKGLSEDYPKKPPYPTFGTTQTDYHVSQFCS